MQKRQRVATGFTRLRKTEKQRKRSKSALRKFTSSLKRGFANRISRKSI